MPVLGKLSRNLNPRVNTAAVAAGLKMPAINFNADRVMGLGISRLRLESVF